MPINRRPSSLICVKLSIVTGPFRTVTSTLTRVPSSPWYKRFQMCRQNRRELKHLGPRGVLSLAGYSLASDNLETSGINLLTDAPFGMMLATLANPTTENAYIDLRVALFDPNFVP